MKFSPPFFHLFSYVQILCSALCHQAFSVIYEVYLIKLGQMRLQTVLKCNKKSANIHTVNFKLFIPCIVNNYFAKPNQRNTQ
jgi:hypothetical protein